MNLLSKRIKELRKERNLTQEELGKLINVTKVSICCYEKGTRLPSLETLIDLSQVFGVSVDYLLGNDYSVIAEDNEEYRTNVSKEEIILIREIKKYTDLHKKAIDNPKRFVELVYKKLK